MSKNHPSIPTYERAKFIRDIRSSDLIQDGSFVCEYAGVVLTHEQA